MCCRGTYSRLTFLAQFNLDITIKQGLLIIALLDHQADVNRAGSQWARSGKYSHGERACRLCELHGSSISERTFCPKNTNARQENYSNRSSLNAGGESLWVLAHQKSLRDHITIPRICMG